MIYANQPMSGNMPDGKNALQTNTVIKMGGFLISISCDNSCGRMDILARSDIRIFNDSPEREDVSHDFFEESEIVCGSAENLYHIMTKIQEESI